MSWNRRPKRSSFGPMSGLTPCRLMWSLITTSLPCTNSRLMPPAALVRITAFTPMRAKTRMGNRSEERRVGKECRSRCDWSSDVCSSDLDNDQLALHKFALDAARRIGKDNGFHAHAGKDADGKRHVLYRVALVEMDAPLHSANRNFSNFADDEGTGVADGGGTRKIRNLRVRNFRCAGELIRECAEARAKDQGNFRLQRGLRGNKFSGEFGTFEFAEDLTGRKSRKRKLRKSRRPSFRRFLCLLRTHVRIPTMAADIKFAMVPASIARMPNLASCPRCSGASAPMPPI